MTNIKTLQAKQFISYLRKQVKESGNDGLAGFGGDHINNPVEYWLQALGFENVVASSIQVVEADNKQFEMSPEFGALLMLTCDNNEYPNEYYEINAGFMLQQALDLINPNAYLIAR